MIYYIVVCGLKYGIRYLLYKSLEDNLPRHIKWIAGVAYVVV